MKTFIVCAMSLDGYIAKKSNEKIDWTSPEDKASFAELTKRAGTVVMGSNTFDVTGNPLPGRQNIVMTRKPRKSDVDNLWFTDQTPQEIVNNAIKYGHKEIAIIGGGHVNAAFLEAGLIDELYVTITPHIFGEGVPLFASSQPVELELLDEQMLGPGEMLHHYRIIR
jgi:dihydrofolate reductase